MLSTVYAIQIKNQNLFKVGYAANPEQRLRELQVGNPFDLILYRRIETFFALEVEKAIHALLSGYEVRGEWFDVSPEIIDSVFGLPATMINGFDIEKTGEGHLATYSIVPSSWTYTADSKVCLSGQCGTPSELETECIQLIQSLLKVLVQSRNIRK